MKITIEYDDGRHDTYEGVNHYLIAGESGVRGRYVHMSDVGNLHAIISGVMIEQHVMGAIAKVNQVAHQQASLQKQVNSKGLRIHRP